MGLPAGMDETGALPLESEFAKSVTTESKMFSIHAVGVIKGYKRETRTRIHAVVDFRSAPTLGAQGGLPGMAGTGGTTTPQTGAVPGMPAGAAGAGDVNAIMAATRPSTGGQVVYYRIE